MEVHFYSPRNHMRWLVNQYESIVINGEADISDKFIPRQDASIIFHFKKTPAILQPVTGQLPQFFIAPVVPKANLIRISRQNDTFIISCKPTVLSRILNINMSQRPEFYIPLPEVPFQNLWQQLASLHSAPDRIRCFEKFIDMIHPDEYCPDMVDSFYNDILINGIHTQLQEIVRRRKVSERTLQRHFQSRLGLSPKSLMRIVRINHLLERIKSNEPVDYQNLVYEGNYFDQTHFIKDFKSVTGETPDFFFNRERSNVHAISGIKVEN